MNSNVIEIQKLVDDWANAIRAVDMEGILAHHTPDVLMFDVPVPLQSVPKARFRNSEFEIRRSILVLKVKVE